MKKYIVKHKDSEKVFGEYASKEEASKRLIEYFNDYNDDICVDFASPFDFTLEEVKCDVNEVVTDLESARKALDIKPNTEFIVVAELLSKNAIQLEYVRRLVNDVNKKHLEAVIALNELFTIAEAWNKSDGFVPDLSDTEQDKWFPWFEYDDDVAGFVYAYSLNSPASARATIGSRLCFNTHERAEQFGKKFVELYNKVFL